MTHNLWFVQWKTTHLMLQAWASVCIVQSSISHYTTWHTLITSNPITLYLCSSSPSDLLNATCRISGTSIWALLLTFCTAWHYTGMEAMMAWMFSMPVQDTALTVENTWTRLPFLSEPASLNDWRMLARLNYSWHFKKHSKNFRGIQCRDLKHLIETFEKV